MHIVIRIFIIAFMSQYIFRHLLHIESNKKKKTLKILSSFIIALITMPIQRALTPLLFNTTLILLLIISVKYIWKLPLRLSIETILISTAVSYITLLILCFIIAPLGAIIGLIIHNEVLSYFISMVIIGLLQFIFFHSLFKVERLRKGMPFLYYKMSGITIIVISAIVVFCVTLFSLHQKADWLFILFSAFLLLSGIGIYILWRYMIKRTYLNLVREREISNLEDIVKRQNLMIEKLEAEHDRLSEIVHRDNKIVPSLILYIEDLISICNYDTTNNSTNSYDTNKNDSNYSLTKLQKAKEDLQKLMAERNTNLQLNNKKAFFFNCGISELDAIVNFLINKASENNIELSANIDIDINDLSPTIISTFDLTTIIGDLLENAIHACSNNMDILTTENEKSINLSFEYANGCFLIKISDNGLPFDKTVLNNLGRIKITSRKKVGGSGIGMFSTIYILKKCKASLCIADSPNQNDNTSFTKDITIYFDNKNEIRVNHESVKYTRNNSL